ncbi:MAG: ComF family protein [Actinobacteria bacterium]|nr:ComF family protein [Actinomycetota bacterium]
MLDLLLPERCAVCGEAGDAVCPRCWRQLPRLTGPRCARCGAPTAWPVARCRECSGRRLAFASARAAVVYDPAVRSVVSAWKEQGRRTLAGLAAELVVEAVPRPTVEAIAFVPPVYERALRRGHHPAERLARKLALRWSLDLVRPLARAGAARPQRGLALAERRRNVAGAFRPSGEAPAALVLVDDVYTSGATASAVASALRRAGARRVEVVTFARAVR